MLPSEVVELKSAVLEASNRVGELLQPSDVVRACLIYCGVLSDVPAAGNADDCGKEVQDGDECGVLSDVPTAGNADDFGKEVQDDDEA